MTTDVSGNSGLDGQSEEKLYGFACIDVLLLKYYELQIRILTSGRSNIEKTRRLLRRSLRLPNENGHKARQGCN